MSVVNCSPESGAREAMTLEATASKLRGVIECIKSDVCGLLDGDEFNGENIRLDGANIPGDMHGNMRANIELAFRALEDARMRLGKVMQAYQGGVSIFDRAEKERLNT